MTLKIYTTKEVIKAQEGFLTVVTVLNPWLYPPNPRRRDSEILVCGCLLLRRESDRIRA